MLELKSSIKVDPEALNFTIFYFKYIKKNVYKCMYKPNITARIDNFRFMNSKERFSILKRTTNTTLYVLIDETYNCLDVNGSAIRN